MLVEPDDELVVARAAAYASQEVRDALAAFADSIHAGARAVYRADAEVLPEALTEALATTRAAKEALARRIRADLHLR